MILSVDNNLDRLLSTLSSHTAANLSAGGTAIPVKNLNSFTAQYAVQIGKTGEEQSEIQIITTPSGTILPLNSGTLVYDHPLDTPVFQIHYDKIIFNRSTSGTAGTATALATVSITPDSLYTEYNDASGAATYAYITQYYNSVSGDLSSESDWFTPSGPSFYSLQKLRDRIKGRLPSSEFIRQDSDIDDWINEWLEELNTAAVKVNKDYLLGTTSIAFGTAGLGTITASDFMYARKVEVTYDGGVSYTNSHNIPVNEYSETDTFSSLDPRHSWQGDTVVRVLPAGDGGTVRITYSKGEAVLVDDTDELPYPMRRYTRSFINYGLYAAKDLDQKAEAEKDYQKALKIKSDFINEITPRDQTGPQTINFTETLSGFQEDDLLGDW